MAVVIIALAGAVVGGVLLGGINGAVFGLVVGAVAGWVAELASRVRKLELKLEARRTAEARAATETAAPPRAYEREPPPPAAPPRVERPAPVPREPIRAAEPEREPVPAAPQAARQSAADSARAMRRPARDTFEASVIEKLFTRAWTYFTTGNVPVKVGVVLSLIGVAFLVKWGVDRRLLVLPIELRLMFVALFGIGLLVLGWRLRTKQRTYALSVQGGGIGVLYITIYASFALYGVLPAALTFALLVVVTAAAGVLAVLQDARSLAVLGTLGGFLAPVLASTGSGNHVALFSYYALLDLAILGIAWFKAWRLLNVLGFLFT
ncbi:MAG TPA: DUF2339 domain-containing protein, partial [Gammaproteobacteria bacterium]